MTLSDDGDDVFTDHSFATDRVDELTELINPRNPIQTSQHENDNSNDSPGNTTESLPNGDINERVVRENGLLEICQHDTQSAFSNPDNNSQSARSANSTRN